MADLTSVPTVELLTRAADAAGKAADWLELAQVAEGMPLSELLAGDAHAAEVCRAVAASGPDHWRAVEAMFRSMLEQHPSVTYTDRPGERYCLVCSTVYVGRMLDFPCPSLQVLRPLAEQVLQHLGDTDG